MQDRRKQPCDVVAARIRINAAVELRVTAQTHMGRCLLHVREYILGDTNEFVATQKGISLSIDKLDAVLEAVWPGEKMLAEAANNRVYATVALLRKAGLRDWIESGPDGYRLDPALRVLEAERLP